MEELLHSSLAGLGHIWVADPVPSQIVSLGVGCTVVVHLECFEVDMAVWVDPVSLDEHMTVDGYTLVDGVAG